MDSASSARPDRGRLRGLSSGWLAILFVAVALVPFVQELTAQPASRYAQTAAMVDHGTIRLDDYAGVLNVDYVVRDGRIYGDKAPLQPIAAMPFYAVARAAGAEPATVLRLEGNLGLWWVTLWFTVVPFLMLVGLGIRVASRLSGRAHAVQATLSICCGTLLLAYGTQLYAHVLAGLLGWGCWLLAEASVRAGREVSRGNLLLAWGAGSMGGAAVATEYPLLIVVAIVGGFLVFTRSWSRLLAFVVGGIPFALLLMAYQAAAYGSPFSVSYSEKSDPGTPGVVVGWPSPTQFMEVLFGTRGMLLFSPVVGLAVWGLVRLARCGDTERRRHGIVGLLTFGAFVAMQSGWGNPWGGEAPGPRYVIPALPFLIVGMGQVWNVAPRAQWLAVRWSVFAMATTVFAVHLTPTGTFAVVAQLQNLRDFGPVDTLWTMLLGPIGYVLHLVSVAGAGWLLVRSVAGEHSMADVESNRVVSEPPVPLPSQ